MKRHSPTSRPLVGFSGPDPPKALLGFPGATRECYCLSHLHLSVYTWSITDAILVRVVGTVGRCPSSGRRPPWSRYV